MDSSERANKSIGRRRASEAAAGRMISYGSAALSAASLYVASIVSGDLVVGVLIAGALLAAAASVAIFGLTVNSPRASAQLLVMLHLICIAGIVAISLGFVSSIIGLIFSVLIMFTVSIADWWPGAALESSADDAKIKPEQSFFRYFSAAISGAYLLFGALAIVFVVHPPTFVFFLVLGCGMALFWLFFRRLAGLLLEKRAALLQ